MLKDINCQYFIVQYVYCTIYILYICSTEKQIQQAVTDYQLKKRAARLIEGDATRTKYNYDGFQMGYECLSNFLREIAKIDCFAAKVAETVYSKMSPFSFQVARISSKQAWVLACAAVENNLHGLLEAPKIEGLDF